MHNFSDKIIFYSFEISNPRGSPPALGLVFQIMFPLRKPQSFLADNMFIGWMDKLPAFNLKLFPFPRKHLCCSTRFPVTYNIIQTGQFLLQYIFCFLCSCKKSQNLQNFPAICVKIKEEKYSLHFQIVFNSCSNAIPCSSQTNRKLVMGISVWKLCWVPI